MRTRSRLAGLTLIATAAIFAACGGSSDDSSGAGPSDDGGSNGDVNVTGDGGFPSDASTDSGTRDSGPDASKDGGTTIDAGPPTDPVATLVSPSATVAGLVVSPDGTKALYIASPVAATADVLDVDGNITTAAHAAHGTLHLVDSTGHDSVIAPTAAVGDYRFTPDGNHFVLSALSINTHGGDDSAAIEIAATDAGSDAGTDAGVGAPITVIANAPLDPTQPVCNVVRSGFFDASGGYFLLGVDDQELNVDASLVVIDIATASTVFEVQNGAWTYAHVTSNDWLYYSALAGGTSTTSTGVVTTYAVPLATAATATPTTLATHVTSLQVSPDGSQLVYLTATGDLFAQAIGSSGPTGSATQLTPIVTTTPIAPPAATQFAVGPDGCGVASKPCRIAYRNGDGSLHVLWNGIDVYDTAANTVDPFSPLVIQPDESITFYRYVKTQEQRGIVYRADLSGVTSAVAATTTSAATAAFGTVTGLADATYDAKATYLAGIAEAPSAILGETNLAAAGAPTAPAFGHLVLATSAPVDVAGGVPSADYRIGSLGMSALLYGASVTTNAPALGRITGLPNYAGDIGATDLASAASSMLANAGDVVSAGNYAVSSEGAQLLFIEQTVTASVPAYDATADDDIGTLHVRDLFNAKADHVVSFTGAPSDAIVVEISPAGARSAFVATSSSTAGVSGVWYLTY
jgi:hypothetical protein